MKRVLVTGATGFIGRHCLPLLAESGFEVHALHRSQQPDIPAHWHQFDLLEGRHEVKTLVESIRPTHLLHMAWCTEHGVYWHSNENFDWVDASLELLQAFAQFGGTRAVVAGTCAEYDWQSGGVCDELKTPLNPATVYGKCKNALRLVLDGYGEQTGISTAWGRIFFAYGPHEGSKRIVPQVVNALLDNQPALCSHGKQVRDLLYVEDTAQAFVDLLKSDVKGSVNISSGEGIALSLLVETIAELMNRQELLKLGAIPAAANDPPLLIGAAQRLRDEVGWQPQVTLETGLNKTIEWWQKQRQHNAVGAGL